MALSLFSQRITTPKSNPSSSLMLAPNSHKKKHNINIIKAENGNLDHLQRASIKTPQPKQPTKKRVVQSSPIVLWDRYPAARTVQQMMDTMERLMDDPTPYRVSQVEPASTYSRGRTPWEIKEGEEDYKMRFDMPGMTREDVKVWVEEKMLVLKAEKIKKDINNNNNNDGENNGKVSDEMEWGAESYVKYSFRIALPENIQFEKIKAEVKDGVLYVTIPKAPVASKILDISVQ
ncbi:small heat shock protein, chloroplastic-like [Bidens hawaiensis]|uniref:small heat shock protein, chloroplastic-like n=1 Tax=Bidens hawaiensis TaxID=980011 RepID=UPI00404A7074